MKPVSSKILINFSPTTSVEKVLDDDFMIPQHKFEFVDLGDLFNVASAYVNPDYPEYSAGHAQTKALTVVISYMLFVIKGFILFVVFI